MFIFRTSGFRAVLEGYILISNYVQVCISRLVKADRGITALLLYHHRISKPASILYTTPINSDPVLLHTLVFTSDTSLTHFSYQYKPNRQYVCANSKCHQRTLDRLGNLPLWSHQSSHRQKRMRPAKCTGDRAQVRLESFKLFQVLRLMLVF